jgi:hypothetical protein
MSRSREVFETLVVMVVFLSHEKSKIRISCKLAAAFTSYLKPAFVGRFTLS